MATVDITDQEFEEKVLQSQTPVLVDFWAPWCGPCRMAEPILDELASEYEGRLNIVKLNVEEQKEQAAKYGIASIPTTILFVGGQEKDRQIGFAGKQAFDNLIQKGI